MANYLIAPCGGGSPIQVNDGGNSLTIGKIYYFTFTGGVSSGCYQVIGDTGPSVMDTINLAVGEFGSCSDCQNASYVFTDCISGLDVYITIDSTISEVGVLTPGLVYNIALIDPLIGSGCYTYTGSISTPESGITIPEQGPGEYATCLNCIQSSGGNFEFVSCSDDQVFVEINTLSVATIPELNQIYFLDTVEGTNGCFTFLGGYTGGTPGQETLNTSTGPFGDCELCLGNTPIGVNSEYTLCTTDCDGNQIELNLPHPVYTTNYGQPVIQLNAVELGGIDGLNN